MEKSAPKYWFPDPHTASPEGLLAVGGDLSPERLLTAYQKGIFPWYGENQPILWWSPDPRMVLFPQKLHLSKSMRQILRKKPFKVSFNQNFEAVITQCARVERKGQTGTWITPAMIEAYTALHKKGYARSVEVWKDQKLVGGLYGVFLKEKHIFCGESMFAKVSNASKYGFVKWVEQLRKEQVGLIDCQVYTEHLESLGAEEIPRKDFLEFLH